MALHGSAGETESGLERKPVLQRINQKAWQTFPESARVQVTPSISLRLYSIFYSLNPRVVVKYWMMPVRETGSSCPGGSCNRQPKIPSCSRGSVCGAPNWVAANSATRQFNSVSVATDTNLPDLGPTAPHNTGWRRQYYTFIRLPSIQSGTPYTLSPSRGTSRTRACASQTEKSKGHSLHGVHSSKFLSGTINVRPDPVPHIR